jgi:hypothetical protein
MMTEMHSSLAVVRTCTECAFFDVRKLGRGSGRGSGFREGNKQRGRLIQHFKSAHPERYAELRKEAGL